MEEQPLPEDPKVANILEELDTYIFRNEPVLIGGLPDHVVMEFLEQQGYLELYEVLTYEQFQRTDIGELEKKRRIMITGAHDLADPAFKQKLWILRARRSEAKRGEEKSVLIISENGKKSHTEGVYQGNPYVNGIKCLFLE